MRLTPERFEQLAFDIATEILAELPPHLRVEAETVMLEVAEVPSPEQARAMDDDDGELLGLYEGVPLIHRRPNMTLLQPDRITLFQNALQSLARTEVELRAQIRKTLIHELGHFFGFGEDELEERGWG
jgi:predicted Zn-dependent protease with MMP-like domain